MKRFFLIVLFILTIISCSQNSYVYNEYVDNEYVDNFDNDLIEICNNNLNVLNFSYDQILDETSAIFKNDYKVILYVHNAEVKNNTLCCPYIIKKNGKTIHESIGTMNLDENLKSGILLSFDDKYLDAWKKSTDLFLDNNKNATFFIYGSCDTISSTCLYLQKEGFEVGYHTLGHKNLMDKDSKTILDEQVIEPLYEFHKNYVYMYSFAFPNGLYVPYQITELLKYFRIVRLFNNKINLYSFEDVCEKRVIISQSIDKNKFSSDEDFEQQMFYRLCLAKITNSVYPCTSHEIVEDIAKTTNKYSISYDRLKYMFDRMDSLNLRSYKYSDFYDAIYW